jgi:integrase/recombinase XerD
MAKCTNESSIINSPKAVKEIDFKTAFSLFLDDSQIRNQRPETIQYYRNELSVFF